jgi:hypothetical protein
MIRGSGVWRRRRRQQWQWCWGRRDSGALEGLVGPRTSPPRSLTAIPAPPSRRTVTKPPKQ